MIEHLQAFSNKSKSRMSRKTTRTEASRQGKRQNQVAEGLAPRGHPGGSTKRIGFRALVKGELWHITGKAPRIYHAPTASRTLDMAVFWHASLQNLRVHQWPQEEQSTSRHPGRTRMRIGFSHLRLCLEPLLTSSIRLLLHNFGFILLNTATSNFWLDGWSAAANRLTPHI